MAKKKQEVEEPSGQRQSRQSRKEVLLERKQAEQLRTIRIGAIIVGVILAAVVVVALVNEFIISPQREVATVAGEKIALQDWQERVEFERAQRIITLEDQLEMLNNDVGMVQQFSGQTINELMDHEGLGEFALDSLARERIVFQALEERGIEISDEEIARRIEESYNYYGGESPTPVPEPTDAPEPTPSVTPIGSEADAADAAPPAAPTSEPVPTATPVSEESFQQEFGDLMGRYKSFGIDENDYRSLVAGSIAAERLLDALAEEQDLPEEGEHASAFLTIFPTEEEAQEALDSIEDADFLSLWNTINSVPPEAVAEGALPPTALEVLWQTEDGIAASYGPEIAEAAFNAPLDQPSAVFEITGPDGSPAYVIIMTSGKETRPFSDNELRSRKIQLLSEYIEGVMNSEVEIGELWRSRLVTRPILDPMFLQAPTPAPELPEAPEVDTPE